MRGIGKIFNILFYPFYRIIIFMELLFKFVIIESVLFYTDIQDTIKKRKEEKEERNDSGERVKR